MYFEVYETPRNGLRRVAIVGIVSSVYNLQITCNLIEVKEFLN